LKGLCELAAGPKFAVADRSSALAEPPDAKVIPTASPSPTSHARRGTGIEQKRFATPTAASPKSGKLL